MIRKTFDVPAEWQPYPPGTPVEILIGRGVGHGEAIPGKPPHAWVRAVVNDWQCGPLLSGYPAGEHRRPVYGVRLQIVGGIRVRADDARYVRRRERA